MMHTLTLKEIGEVSGGYNSDGYEKSQTRKNISFIADNITYLEAATTVGYGLAFVAGVSVSMPFNSALSVAAGVAIVGSAGYLCVEAAYNSYYQ
ncbi:hypothetical protein [uncultured Shewanella sp.]|uniref:hypothetical protein n=1 Tax=uncultured Shewanella sp. TaxID=173975 RepID=UPI002602302C|nr:hypothetical protein [uncultured Shewanella sp.]